MKEKTPKIDVNVPLKEMLKTIVTMTYDSTDKQFKEPITEWLNEDVTAPITITLPRIVWLFVHPTAVEAFLREKNQTPAHYPYKCAEDALKREVEKFLIKEMTAGCASHPNLLAIFGDMALEAIRNMYKTDGEKK